MNKFNPQVHEFASHLNTHIGQTVVHDGDRIFAIERTDYLWDLKVNDQPTGHAVDNFYLNQLAGATLVGA
jgi:hypothetical protein